MYEDEETGFYYCRTRFLMFTLGRYCNRNPWGYMPFRYNLYDFDRMNPIRFTEPFSEPVELIVGGLLLLGGVLLLKGDQGPAAPAPRPIDYSDCDCVGKVTLHIRISWAIGDTKENQAILDSQIANMKQTYIKCCIEIDVSYSAKRVDRGLSTGGWNADKNRYADDLIDLAQSFDTDGGKKVPVIVNSTVSDAGGMTIANRYSPAQYKGPAGVILPVVGPPTFSLSHEVGHVAGLEHPDDTVAGQKDVKNIMSNGPNVSSYECEKMRALASQTS